MTKLTRISALLAGLTVWAQAVPAATTEDLCARFSGYDINNDGLIEIEGLRPMPIHPAARLARQGLVIVLVEERLLSPLPGEGGNLDLRPSLSAFVEDLGREGWDGLTIVARVYSGPVHQDGRTLLAMRRFVAALDEQFLDFAGVVLVGDFPEAYLVRSCNWRKHTKITLNKGKPNEQRFQDEEV
ncbi:MAG: hypothetical protein ACE5JM_15000, partial [Armatimonadota bacterium]